MKRASVWILALWCFMVIAEGLLRYLFASTGFPALIYAKDALLAVLACWYLLYVAVNLRVSPTLATVLAVLGYGALLALWHRFPLPQIAFGLKIFLTFIVGYTAVSSLSLEGRSIRRLFRIAVPLVAAGLLFEMFNDVPWKGFEYEAFGQTVEGSRMWGMSGLPRLAGFGRVSYETANILFCLSALYLADRFQRPDRDKNTLRVIDGLLLLVCFAGIVVTTAKTALIAYLVLAGVLLVVNLQRRFRGDVRTLLRGAMQFTLVGLGMFAVVPPVIAAVSPATVTDLLRTNNIIFNIIASSYVARMERMWPEAFQLLSLDHSVLTGRGVGGIGTAQLYFESGRYNAADNMFVYLTISFGIAVAAAVLGWLIWKTLHLRADHPGSAYFVVLAVIGLVCAATMNVIESASLTMSAGIALAFWQRTETEALQEPRRDFQGYE